MRVLFLQDNGINESLVLAEISAVLRSRGHRTRLLLDREEKALVDESLAWRPDLVFIPCAVLAHRTALGLAERVRSRFPGPIVLGGTYPTFFPEIVRHPAVTYAIRGECDEALPELLETIGEGTDPRGVPNLVLRENGAVHSNPVRPLVGDLDRLPLPDRDLYFRYPFIRRFPWKKFLSSRGCLYSCTYCYQPPLRSLYGTPPAYVRRKSVARVIREIRAVRDEAPIGHVHFADDLFGSDVAWLEDLAGRYPGDVGIPFTCNTTPELATHRSVRALERAGCRAIGFGIESGVEARRREILGRRTTDEQIREAADRIRRAGMKLVTFNMIGTPGETVEEVFASIRLNTQIGADYARATLAVPVPGTVLAEKYSGGAAASASLVDFRDRGGGTPAPAFSVPERLPLANLYSLFVWATMFPRIANWVRRLALLPPNPLFRLAGSLRAVQERRIFRVPLIAGLRYYYHAGAPDKRSSNFVGLP